uniref:Uncharacterized protein n=1 Tax=Denticeps clupeoides TaxID=299321 RepID=A0AAY4BR98_9TELE
SEGCRFESRSCCNLAYMGHLEKLRSCILANKSLASKPDRASWTPLHIAASAGREDIVRSLIAKGANCPSLVGTWVPTPNATDKLDSTPLHRASAKGNYRLIQLLLAQSASTNIQDAQGNTPLHLACDEERVEAAKLLVEHGASIYIENKEEKTPLGDRY